jgi:hypothetical protein
VLRAGEPRREREDEVNQPIVVGDWIGCVVGFG